MNFTLKKLLIFIITIILLTSLVLFDPRGSIIAEPGEVIKAAISIAISHLVYGINGFVGLNEILDVLDEIPVISNYQSRHYALLGGFILDFDNINEVKEYVKITSDKIFEAKNLFISNKNNLHAFQNDIGYLFFIVLSFLLFGIKLKSISILFITIIILSSIIFMVNFYKNNVYFFLLQTILFSLIIGIIGNYGGSVQLASTTNLRFMSILCIIPVFHLSIIFLEKNIFTFKNFLTVSFQFLLLIFLCLVRGTAMWGFLFLVLFYSIWILKIGLKNFSKYKSNFFSMIGTVLLFIMIFNLSQLIIKKNLAEEYNNKNIITKHLVWHSLFLSVAMKPTIHENYVCSDTKLEDIYFDTKPHPHIPCGIYPFKFSGESELYKNIFFYIPRDTHGFHAAIKYLHDNNLNEQIGITSKYNREWNINLARYEEILKILYFKILFNHPMEFLYIHLVIKPLKFLYEFIKYVFYFLNSFKINFIFIFLIFIASLFIQFFCMTKIKIEKELVEIKNFNYNHLIETIFLTMLLASSAPSIVFYPSAQSGIYDCVVVLITLIIFYLKRKFIKIQ